MSDSIININDDNVEDIKKLINNVNVDINDTAHTNTNPTMEGMINLIIDKNLEDKGRVMLQTDDSCITISICPTTKEYFVEGFIQKNRDFGTFPAKSIKDAFNFIKDELKVDLKNITEIT
jgi:hypothetical protein